MERNAGIEPASFVFAEPILKLAESRGVEPHPISENLVFKASRRTNAPALLSIIGGSGEIRTHGAIADSSVF